jgi:hypothetical protein
MNVVRMVDVVEFYMINQEGGKIKTERNFKKNFFHDL